MKLALKATVETVCIIQGRLSECEILDSFFAKHVKE